MNKTTSLHFPITDPSIKNSFHAKPLTSQRGRIKNETFFSRTSSNFGNSLHINSTKTPLNDILESHLPKPTGTIRLNMANHFLILEHLHKVGGLDTFQGFKYSREGANNKNISLKKKEKCDVFQIMNNCNLKALENFPKMTRNQEKKTSNFEFKSLSPKLREQRKSILRMKKEFFYFEKQKILKKGDGNQKNKAIGQIYQKFFERKNINKLCNLKEFSNFLVQKKGSPKSFSDEEEENGVTERKATRNEIIKKLPRLQITGIKGQRNSFL